MANIDWESLVSDLVTHCETYHNEFYKIKNFTGPSYHFHIRALEAHEHEKAEMIYALLTSWGMHRMGGGPKMKEFKEFESNLLQAKAKIDKLKALFLDENIEMERPVLKEIYNDLQPMISNRKMVAFSKVMAHYLPNLIPPVDNEYTFRFIYQKSVDKYLNVLKDDFEFFDDIHQKLFRKVALNLHFKEQASLWLQNKNDYRWDTSIPKIIDNLIVGKIGAMKGIGITATENSSL